MRKSTKGLASELHDRHDFSKSIKLKSLVQKNTSTLPATKSSTDVFINGRKNHIDQMASDVYKQATNSDLPDLLFSDSDNDFDPVRKEFSPG